MIVWLEIYTTIAIFLILFGLFYKKHYTNIASITIVSVACVYFIGLFFEAII